MLNQWLFVYYMGVYGILTEFTRRGSREQTTNINWTFFMGEVIMVGSVDENHFKAETVET